MLFYHSKRIGTKIGQESTSFPLVTNVLLCVTSMVFPQSNSFKVGNIKHIPSSMF